VGFVTEPPIPQLAYDPTPKSQIPQNLPKYTTNLTIDDVYLK